MSTQRLTDQGSTARRPRACAVRRNSLALHAQRNHERLLSSELQMESITSHDLDAQTSKKHSPRRHGPLCYSVARGALHDLPADPGPGRFVETDGWSPDFMLLRKEG